MKSYGLDMAGDYVERLADNPAAMLVDKDVEADAALRWFQGPGSAKPAIVTGHVVGLFVVPTVVHDAARRPRPSHQHVQPALASPGVRAAIF